MPLSLESSARSLLVVGASARAAACSARRAGFEPLACDLFGDADLRQLCPWVHGRDYPAGLAVAAAQHPPCPWLYTGGLENHPETVDRIARDRPLLGNTGDILRAVRDPWRFTAALDRCGLPVPRCERIGAAAAPGEGWLLKRRTSAGGAGVRAWRGTLPRHATADDCFLQQRVAGRPCAAVYVAARGQAALVGVTEQLIGAGADWCGGRGFRYCGSLGPLRLSPDTTDRFRRIGDCLASEFRLTGLFGVDAILNRHGVWPVEVNPRYTASVEVLERALDLPAMRWHVEACLHGRLPEERRARRRKPPWCGKAILFASRAVEIDEALAAEVGRIVNPSANPVAQPAEWWPPIADIPIAGSRIAAHRPIMTLLAAGGTRVAVLHQLQSAARHWNARLGVQGAGAARG